MLLIESERLYVRYYTMDDEENFCRLNMDEEVMRYIRPVKTRDDTIAFFKQIIARYQSDRPDMRLALLEKGTNIFVGSFAIIPIDQTPDTQLGYSFLKEHWGKGYATEITKAGIEYIFNTLQLPEVYGVTESENIPSQKVLLKSGFVFHKNYKEGEKEMNVYVLRRYKV
jgi:[ribosomal protein S5]-alanine N-acetyltransferase